MRKNNLPEASHGDLLDTELRDLLGMLDEALSEDYRQTPTQPIVDARNLLRSILGEKLR